MPQDETHLPARTAPRAAGGSGLFLVLALVGSALLLSRKGETWLRSFLLYLSRPKWACALVTGFGPAWNVAKRFVAGESVDEAITATRQLNDRGLSVTLYFLGESVTSVSEANVARDQSSGCSTGSTAAV